MGKGKKKINSPAGGKGFSLEDLGFEEGSDNPIEPDLGLSGGSNSQIPSTPVPVQRAKDSSPVGKQNRWSLKGTPNPFLTGKGFPILAELQAQGVSLGILALIWLRILDWEDPRNRDFKAEVLEAASKGQVELDLLLKRTTEHSEFDLEDLEGQRLEEASLVGPQTKPDFETRIDEVLANSPSSFLSETGRRALPPISEKPHTWDSPVAGDFGICRGTHATGTEALTPTVAVDNASVIPFGAAVGNTEASDEFSVVANGSNKAIGIVPVAADRMLASRLVDFVPDLHNAAMINTSIASVTKTSKRLPSDFAPENAVDIEEVATAIPATIDAENVVENAVDLENAASDVDNIASVTTAVPGADFVNPANAITADYRAIRDPSGGSALAANIVTGYSPT